MSTEVKEKLDAAKAKFEQAKSIMEKQGRTAEETKAVADLVAEGKALRDEATVLRDILDNGIGQIESELGKKSAGVEGPVQDREVKYWRELNLLSDSIRDGTRPSDIDKIRALLGKEEKGRYPSWGEFLNSAWKAQHPRYMREQTDPRLLWFKDEDAKSIKDLSGQSGAGGGYLIPAEFMAQLMGVLGEGSIVRQRATVIRMRNRQLDIPVLDQTSTAAGRPHWFGGLRFYWAEEASEKTSSDPVFRQVSLLAHKLIGLTRASDELVDDSAISLGDFLSGPMGFSGGVQWMEDYSFLRGTGAGQPLGVLNAGATITVARTAAGAIGFADLANMMEQFLPSGRGVWVISQSAMSDLIQLNGPAGNPSYIWQPNARDGVPGYLLGFPVIWSEKLPNVGSAGAVLLADFRYYLIGDRQATTVDSTIFEKWAEDKTSWRVVHRVDGQPWLSAPLTYEDGSTQVSPFVVLGGVSVS